MFQSLKICCRAGTCAILLISLAVCHGCGKRELPPEQPPRLAQERGPVLAGTVGSISYLANIVGQQVRGFGVVVGLGDAGSSDCPTVIREYLVETMNKEVETWNSLMERRRFSANQLIDSPSTAVVEIAGVVPAGARTGASFDISVQAIPGTATRTLAGGLLLPCELRIAGVTGTDEDLLGGTAVARAAGPVFVNPFAEELDRSMTGGARIGYVLGGGETTEDRTSRLLLREPSYPAARRVERRVNERFGPRPLAAEAMSRGYLLLHTPSQYANRSQDFIQMVTHLYLEDHPVSIEKRLRELAGLIVKPEAAHEDIALAWEGIGRTALPYIQPLYTHEDPRVSFHAARAGLRLKDVNAIPILAEIARGGDVNLSRMAVRELGDCQYPQAAIEIQPLLDNPNQQVRIAAYEALLLHRHPAVRSLHYRCALDRMQLNMVLDVVESQGPPLIYVRRSRLPRIAVFGDRTPITVPLFHVTKDDSLTLNALDENSEITIFTKHGTQLSEPIQVPPRLVDLIGALADLPVKDEAGRIRGVGLPYSQIVEVLVALSRDQTLPGELVIENLSLTELLGPELLPERQEADDLESFDQPDGRRESDEILLPAEAGNDQ
ncbi:MAG: flagellar basal body P-ring protein FlgI [Planctomycetota bacterium]